MQGINLPENKDFSGDLLTISRLPVPRKCSVFAVNIRKSVDFSQNNVIACIVCQLANALICLKERASLTVVVAFLYECIVKG